MNILAPTTRALALVAFIVAFIGGLAGVQCKGSDRAPDPEAAASAPLSATDPAASTSAGEGPASAGVDLLPVSSPASAPSSGPASGPGAASGPASGPSNSGAEGNEMERWLALAKRDLADTDGVDPSDIEVVEARSVTWPDGSIGCPKPGMMYTMALVPGGLIRLSAHGRTYAYHCATGQDPLLCDSASAKPPIDAAPVR